MSAPVDALDRARLAALVPASASRLLQHALAGENPPPSRRIFVNRTLRMDKIRYVGFDLDWTLADYDQDAMAELAFGLTLARMVERFGYPEEILRAEFRADFLRRGLLIDTRAGTVLKMNRHRYVGRAYFGPTFLAPEERARLYRHEPINPTSDRFYIADTLFELPELNVFSELVEMKKRLGDRLPTYGEMFRHGREAIDSIHADGTLKERILGDLDRYLPRDPLLAAALERLALGARKLILITNSEPYYTAAVASHLLDGALPGISTWREIFDLVVCLARKPAFFRKRGRFEAIDDAGEPGEELAAIEWGGAYAGGSRAAMMELLACPGEEVLYVGDHIYGDVVSSKLTSTWRTALVVRELDEELRVRERLASQLRHLVVLRAESNEIGHRVDDLGDVLALLREHSGGGERPVEIARAEAALGRLQADHKALRKHVKRLQERFSKAINPYWGSVFKQGGNKSLFGAQVDDFACVYTSHVSNFAHYGSQHYYRVLRDPMMHELEV